MKAREVGYPDWTWHTEPTKLCARHHAARLHYGAKRRATQLNATPTWADQSAIKAIYAECARLNAEGGRWHVDHIVPLKGRRVSGLHVENNLQILPASKNVAKGNRF